MYRLDDSSAHPAPQPQTGGSAPDDAVDDVLLVEADEDEAMAAVGSTFLHEVDQAEMVAILHVGPFARYSLVMGAPGRTADELWEIVGRATPHPAVRRIGIA